MERPPTRVTATTARSPAPAPLREADRRPRRLSRSALGAHLRIPLYREAYALVLSSALTSLFGVVYWLLAAHHYPPHVLGENSAAIAAMMFLAGVAQLNLMSALMRFIPIAGDRTTRFVLSSYVLSVVIAAVVALVFLLGLEVWAPALHFLVSSPGFVLWFAAATMAWCIFNLQDSVLTGLRRAMFVPIENLVHSVVKIALLVAFVEVSPHYGIFASWTAALVATLVPVNLLIFGRLIPRHVMGRENRLPPRRQVARFVSADYVGALFWLAATTLMPVIVAASKGATVNAYFSLAWMIALPLFAVSASTGASLVVTAAEDEARLASYARQSLVQTAGIVVPVAIGLALLAPDVLRVFGAEYAEHSTATLRLLALSAVPCIVNLLYVSVYRVQRRMSRVVMVLGFQCGLVLVLGVVLLEVLGIAGIGVAWLVAQSVVAAALLLLEPRALRPSGGRGDLAEPAPRASRPVGMIRKRAADLGFLDVLARLRRAPADLWRTHQARRLMPEILASIPADGSGEPPTSWAQQRSIRTVSDMTVITAAPRGKSPRALIKLPTTPLAVQSLRREQDVLLAMNADARLRGWSGLLPKLLAKGECGSRPYVVQRRLPGVDASRLVASGEKARQVLTLAASSIGELHRRTATPAVVDRSILKRWVDDPALVLRRMGGAFASDLSTGVAIDKLVGELHEALEGRTLPLSRVHGDFVLSNILLSPHTLEVTGIVDWELAASADLPAIDIVSLLLSTRAHLQRHELGHVVRELLTGEQWTEFEQALLDSASLRLPGGRVDSRTVVLLWWLRHVAGNLTKSTRYPRHYLWVRWNVRAVLDTLQPA